MYLVGTDGDDLGKARMEGAGSEISTTKMQLMNAFSARGEGPNARAVLTGRHEVLSAYIPAH